MHFTGFIAGTRFSDRIGVLTSDPAMGCDCCFPSDICDKPTAVENIQAV
jgi:hypothetical protein